MAQSVITANVKIKVNRAIGSATTVGTNCYAVVSYTLNTIGGSSTRSRDQLFNKYFGPGQSIPATITLVAEHNGFSTNNVFSLSSGVEFINSP